MAGIYLHIPFCRQACHYCNFHFSTSLRHKDELLQAMLRELELQSPYLAGEVVETIYFGGGTPSLLDIRDLDLIFDKIFSQYKTLDKNALEITLEANPDDLTLLKINELRKTPVNRLSIGVQSFSDEDLAFFNRAHRAGQAATCIYDSLAAGFDNLSLDLIYGAPTTSDEQWERNLEQALQFGIPHLSCYCLTVEPGTALAHFVKKQMAPPVDDEKALRHFEKLMEWTALAGYEHYEISNFALASRYSRHNTSYWQGKKYLGIGPSAHSYDGRSRQWNVANNARYLSALADNKLPFEQEMLTSVQQYNEYVMIRLRTMWGCDLEQIRSVGFEEHFMKEAAPLLAEGLLHRNGDVFRLTREGKFLADGVAAALFAEESPI